MMSLVRLALTATLIAASVNPVLAARGANETHDHATLQLFKKIGVGWQTGKFGWMGFVSFSPDGTMVASDGPATPGDNSGDLTIWKFPQGTFIRRLPGPPCCMAGDWKYYVDHDGIRDMESGERVMFRPASVYTIYAFADDGAYVAAYSDKNPSGRVIHVFALKAGKEIAAFGKHAASALAISPNGKLLASGGWDIVTLWNLQSGSRIGALRGFGRYVNSLSFSRDGKLLAAGTDEGGLQMWDVHRHKRLYSVNIGGGEVSTPAFSPNGQLVAVGIYGTGTVWLIDARSGSVLDSKKVSDLGCGAVAFSPDGHYLITPSTGGLITWPWDVGGTIRVFSVLGRKNNANRGRSSQIKS